MDPRKLANWKPVFQSLWNKVYRWESELFLPLIKFRQYRLSVNWGGEGRRNETVWIGFHAGKSIGDSQAE